MTFSGLLDSLQASGLSRYIAGTNHLVTAGLQVVHILGFVLLLASATLFALRVYGVVFRDTALLAITREAHLMMLLGLALAVLTGAVMVIGAPHHYFANPAFLIKLSLLAMAVIAQFGTYIYLARPSACLTFVRAGTSSGVVLWLGVSFAGRAIGFV